jgi:hypothetical protein
VTYLLQFRGAEERKVVMRKGEADSGPDVLEMEALGRNLPQ